MKFASFGAALSTDSEDKKEENEGAGSDGAKKPVDSTSSGSTESRSIEGASESRETGTPTLGTAAADSNSSPQRIILGSTKQPATQKSFLLELLLAQALLLLVCMAGTSLWLWGDLGLTSSKNMSDSLRDFHELALLRKPIIAWSFPLMSIAGIASGPREALNGRWLSMVSWIFITFLGTAALLCYLGQPLPFIGAAAPKALNMVLENRLFLVPFLANAGLSAIIYLLRGMKLFVDEDKKAGLLGLVISLALIEISRIVLSGKP